MGEAVEMLGSMFTKLKVVDVLLALVGVVVGVSLKEKHWLLLENCEASREGLNLVKSLGTLLFFLLSVLLLDP